jgi:hypothetical protein
MTDRFIIVQRDLQMRDSGVFTGQIQVVDYHMHFWDADRSVPMQGMDGVASPDIEHAFIFNAAYSAWRYAMQFEPHWDGERNRYWGFRRWEARKDLDFFPGEVHHGLALRNPCIHGKVWIPQEALIAATQEGFKLGEASARRELA